jgi:hypothetical protein
MASRTLRNEAEIAADDAVIASGMRPSSYAGELLQLASEFRSREPALAGMPLFMAAPSALEARVKSVLAATPYRSGVTAKDVVRIGGIALLATTAMTFARPSFAQEETPPSPPAVTSAPLPPPAEPAKIAEQSVPAAMPQTPPVPETPVPAAPAKEPLPAPAALPAPASVTMVQFDSGKPYIRMRESDRTVHGHKIRHVWVDIDTRGLTEAELARMRPQIERAEAQARAAEAEVRAHEAEIRAVQERMPAIEAQMRAELARVQPEIDRAIAQAHLENIDMKIREKMDRAMKRMQMQIELQERDVKDRAAQGAVPDDGPADDPAAK